VSGHISFPDRPGVALLQLASGLIAFKRAHAAREAAAY
jgi:hypothetical protein